MKVIVPARQDRRTGTVTQRLWLTTIFFAACSTILIAVLDKRYYTAPDRIIDCQWKVNFSQPQILVTDHVSLTTREKTTTTTTQEGDTATSEKPKLKYHTVISTSCSAFQNWQSYVFFYHLLRSGQEGHVTRIASGCKRKDAIVLQETFDKDIAVMAPGRFHLHLTPDYSQIKPTMTYRYFNKPFGVQHWMEESLGYPTTREQHDDTIIILMDPDQILLRPFTNDFTNSSEIWKPSDKNKLKVEHGSPFAQRYGYQIRWKKLVNIEYVFNGPSPVSNISDDEALQDYIAIGPPYIATGKDMYTLVKTWTEIVPRVLDNYPNLLAEMFGYNLAAAHHGLHHTTALSFMVSDIISVGEGWAMIKQIPPDDVCHDFPLTYYPHVLHYCQEYYLGKWFISKYNLRHDFISCESPLLEMPPEDLATRGYRAGIHPGESQKVKVRPWDVKKQAFMVCTLIRALNEAAIYYKNHHCTKENVNYAHSLTFHNTTNTP